MVKFRIRCRCNRRHARRKEPPFWGMVAQYLLGKGKENQPKYAAIAAQQNAKFQQAAAMRGYGRGSGAGSLAGGIGGSGMGASLLQGALAAASQPKGTQPAMGGWTSAKDAVAGGGGAAMPRQIIGPTFRNPGTPGTGVAPSTQGLGWNQFGSGFGPGAAGRGAAAAPAASPISGAAAGASGGGGW